MHKHTSPPETTPGNSRNCAEDPITMSTSILLGKDKPCWGCTPSNPNCLEITLLGEATHSYLYWGWFSPNPIRLGISLRENHQHKPYWEGSNLQARWGDTDLKSVREVTLSHPLGKYSLLDTEHPSSRRIAASIVHPPCRLSSFENTQTRLDSSDSSHEDRIPGIHTNFPVLRLWRVFLVNFPGSSSQLCHGLFIVRLSLAPGWTLWGFLFSEGFISPPVSEWRYLTAPAQEIVR